jgi:hypothetical protein
MNINQATIQQICHSLIDSFQQKGAITIMLDEEGTVATGIVSLNKDAAITLYCACTLMLNVYKKELMTRPDMTEEVLAAIVEEFSQRADEQVEGSLKRGAMQ